MATLNFTAGIIVTDRYCRAPKGGTTIGGKFYRGGQFTPNCLPDDLAVLLAPTVKPTITRTTIAGFVYAIAPLAIDRSIGSAAFALHKIDANVTHHVHTDAHSETKCTCGDYVYRKAGTGATCKHIRALIDLGLVARPPVEVLKPFAARHAGPAVLATLPARRRRFEPSAEESRLAAQMFA